MENSIGKKIKDEMKIKWENEQAHSVNIARQGRYAKKQQVPKLLPFVQQAFFCFNLFFRYSSYENKKWCVKKCSKERREEKNLFHSTNSMEKVMAFINIRDGFFYRFWSFLSFHSFCCFLFISKKVKQVDGKRHTKFY